MKTPSQSDKNGVKLQFIKVNQMYRQMTIYGQNEGYFKPEKNECIATGAWTKFHKIKIVVFFLLSACGAMTRIRHEIRHCDVIAPHGNKNRLTGNLSTYFPAKFRHIRCILLLSMA